MDSPMLSGRWIRAAATAALFLVLAQKMDTLHAASFQINPIRVDLSAKQAIAALKIANNGAEPVVLQLQAVAWSQEDGSDRYEPTNDLVTTPPIFTVQPGVTQIIRVGLRRGADPETELAYRLFVQEVPAAPKPGDTGIRMTMRFGIPVFVQPKAKSAPALQWSFARQGGGQLKVSLKNHGKTHFRLTDFTVSLPDQGKALASQQVAAYLLPGQSRHWMLAADPAQPINVDKLQIKAGTATGPLDTYATQEKQ